MRQYSQRSLSTTSVRTSRDRHDHVSSNALPEYRMRWGEAEKE